MSVFARRGGYTLVEVIVALLVFSVGGLALMSTATVLAAQLGNDARRERAARIAASRLEDLRAACRLAASGSELTEGIRSVWSVAVTPGNLVAVVETVSYLTLRGRHTDTVRAVLPCA